MRTQHHFVGEALTQNGLDGASPNGFVVDAACSGGRPPPKGFAAGGAAAGGGAPKENVGAFALSLLASFFSSSSSSPQFVAFVSKSDMAARGVGEAAAWALCLCKHACSLCVFTQQQRCD